jgi:hypothetical protein
LGIGIERLPECVLDKIKELNDKVFHILGLRESERVLIQDFIAMNMQCVEGKVPKEVLARPSESTMRVYLERLQQELDAFIAGESETQHEISACYDTRSAMIVIRLPQTGSSQSPVIRAADRATSQEFAKISERLQQRHFIGRSDRRFLMLARSLLRYSQQKRNSEDE